MGGKARKGYSNSNNIQIAEIEGYLKISEKIILDHAPAEFGTGGFEHYGLLKPDEAWDNFNEVDAKQLEDLNENSHIIRGGASNDLACAIL